MQIGVLLNQVPHDASTSRYADYIAEILDHAGLPWVALDQENLAAQLQDIAVLLLPAHLPVAPAQQEVIADFVKSGRALLACGGTSGLDEVLGCRERGVIEEAWVRPFDAQMPLHAFGGRLVEPGRDVQVLAHWLAGDEYCSDSQSWGTQTLGPAATLRRVGRGFALLIAADLVHSIVRIQQGKPIHRDGQPAADGTAPVNDGILKTDDGIVLDYERDRQPIGDTSFFGQGIADLWRAYLLKAIFWSLKATNTALPMLWYWPQMLPAVGMLSHDTDGNKPELADILLANLQRLDVLSTWCIIYPGGYAPGFYRQLRSHGYEIALHYDAHTQKGRTCWHENDFRLQLAWLRDMAGCEIFSNKNHYLRWEGLDEFFVWLERAGILSDESKGPSKRGNTGFPFGGCHPWFPIHEHRLRLIDVLEVNLATQDLALTCPAEVGPAVIDWACAQHGVAHFLFHPNHAANPDVAAAMQNVVNYGKEKKIPWWTNYQVQDWERRRRQVEMSFHNDDAGRRWRIKAGETMENAAIVWFGAAPADQQTSGCQVHGFPAQATVLDLEEEKELLWEL